VAGGITASWNKVERRGELKVHINLTSMAFIHHCSMGNTKDARSTLSRFFAAWYGVAFPLHDLLPIKVKESSDLHRQTVQRNLLDHESFSSIMVEFNEENKKDKKKDSSIFNEEKERIIEFNKRVDQTSASYSFVSSTGTSCGGGICNDDVSFRGTLRRYFSGTVIEDVQSTNYCDTKKFRYCWLAKNFGLVAHHRLLCYGDQHGSVTGDTFERTDFRTYLHDEDYPLLMENASAVTSAIWNRTKTFAGLFQQLENLGYAAAPHIDGLSVELLNYQKEAVWWAVERENMVGGIQRLYWTKLPVEHGGTTEDLWYNPVLDCVSTTPPKRVRGGFICHEMGERLCNS